ncbi:hypothetical protein GQ54DRAFT_299690 [Martensiomyces pterosporus]|nr:hypothetical protein GQ54DRAFT_299690 [Martensiomyces pterosporus]
MTWSTLYHSLTRRSRRATHPQGKHRATAWLAGLSVSCSAVKGARNANPDWLGLWRDGAEHRDHCRQNADMQGVSETWESASVRLPAKALLQDVQPIDHGRVPQRSQQQRRSPREWAYRRTGMPLGTREAV